MEIIWSEKIDKILKVGSFLSKIGINNWALKKTDAIDALVKFSELKISIVGGDVFENIEGTIQSNYDSWYCEKLPEESEIEFAERSIIVAKNYIDGYIVKDSGSTFFVIVPSICS